MKSPSEIMAQRKEVVGRAIEASERGDEVLAEKLRIEAYRLMTEADELIEKGGKFTAKDAYGLMGH